MTKPRPSYDEAEHDRSRKTVQSLRDFGLFETPEGPEPDIRTPVPVAPGSATSQLAADAIDGPFRRKSWRLVMLALGSASRPLSREELSERTGLRESSLCARLSELRPVWIEAVSGACVASSGISVDGYRLTDAGRQRLAKNGGIAA